MVPAGDEASSLESPAHRVAAVTRKRGGAATPWRALRHRNFRLYFFGQSISLIGTWMMRIATSWLVYRLTGSALLLGTVSFSGQIPTFLLAPFAGVWADRLNRRKLLVWTQTILAVQSFLLAGFTLTGHINIAGIMALSIVQGLVNAFDMPGRQSFVVQMIDDRADLGNAIAINSTMVNTARLIGPSLAGLLIGATNEGWCFFINGVSFIAVIVSLLLMRVHVSQSQPKHASTYAGLKEGWTYVTGFLPIRVIMTLLALISLMGMPYTVLMPIFAARVLHGGPHTLGFLMGAGGVGALFAALSLAARKSVRGLMRKIPVSALIFGAGLIGLGVSHWLWLSVFMSAIAGMGMMQGMAASNTIIQTLVSEDKRGRVMSFWTMAFVGMAPFGSLLAGTLAHTIPTTPLWIVAGMPLSGTQWTVILNGTAVILGALWFFSKRPALRAVIRPIYEEMGIIPTKEELAAEQVEAS